MASILEFFKTGQLDRIVIGMLLKDFESIAGTPQDVSMSKNPMIYKYGSFQFAFTKRTESECRLTSIHLYCSNDLVLTDELSLSDRDPEIYENHEKLMEYLQQSDVNIHADQHHIINNVQMGYSTEGGVILIFAIEDNVKTLVSIHKN